MEKRILTDRLQELESGTMEGVHSDELRANLGITNKRSVGVGLNYNS